MPSGPLLLACSLLDVFCKIFAEMCAGSLMSGCSFDVTCFSIHGELGVEFGTENMSFSMLVASKLAPWGPSSDAGGLGSTRKETLGVQAWIFIDFGRMTESTPRVIGVAVGER